MTTEPNDGTWELQDEMRCPVCNIVGGQHTLGCRTRGITHWDGCGEIETPEHAGCFISMDKQTTLRVPPERAILIDLIAELVGDDGDGHELTGDDKHGCQVCAAIDRAEARLREVTGDE